MKSLRTRLLVGMIGSFALLLLVFGLVIDASIEYMLVREFDFYLETVGRTLAAAVDHGRAGIRVKLVPEALPDIQQVEGELFSQYWTDDGAVLAKSTNLSSNNLPRFHAAAGQPQIRTFVLPDGRHARAAGMRFPLPGDRRHLTVVVARDTSDLESHVWELRWLLLAAGAGTMAVGAVVSVGVIRRSLMPLGRLASAIAAIREEDLAARIPADKMPDEMVPVVQRLNELLGRLEQAFVRERSLTADIAHELRTPVGGILSTAGVALTSDRAPAEYQEALEDVRGIARRMRSMIESLLMLARLDFQAAGFQQERIHLRDLVSSCWQRFHNIAAARGLVFENHVPDDVSLLSDPDALSIVFSNLLENAAEYSNECGTVRVNARNADGAVELEVANTGCTLSEEQVAHVFDRFWRADPSRKDSSSHAGLGLALVRRIATSLGGTASAEGNDDEFTVRLRLPAAI